MLVNYAPNSYKLLKFIWVPWEMVTFNKLNLTVYINLQRPLCTYNLFGHLKKKNIFFIHFNKNYNYYNKFIIKFVKIH